MNTIIRYLLINRRGSGSGGGSDFWVDESGRSWRDENNLKYKYLPPMNLASILLLPVDPNPRRIYADDRGDFYDILAGAAGSEAMKSVTTERFEEVTRISNDLTLGASHRSVYGELGAGSAIVTLPDHVAFVGKMYFIKKSSGEGILFVDASPSTLDGSPTPWELTEPGHAIVVQSDGYEWKILASFIQP